MPDLTSGELVVAVVVAAMVATLTATVVGSIAARRRGTLLAPLFRGRAHIDRMGRLAVVVFGLGAAAIDARLAVFWMVVVANLVFGTTEAVPLSRYGMFTSPTDTAWAIRVETPDGALVPIGRVGVRPGQAHKRFSSIEAAAIAEGASVVEARSAAADDLAERIIEGLRGHREHTAELRLVRVEWRLGNDGADVDRQILTTMPPA